MLFYKKIYVRKHIPGVSFKETVNKPIIPEPLMLRHPLDPTVSPFDTLHIEYYVNVEIEHEDWPEFMGQKFKTKVIPQDTSLNPVQSKSIMMSNEVVHNRGILQAFEEVCNIIRKEIEKHYG